MRKLRLILAGRRMILPKTDAVIPKVKSRGIQSHQSPGRPIQQPQKLLPSVRPQRIPDAAPVVPQHKCAAAAPALPHYVLVELRKPSPVPGNGSVANGRPLLDNAPVNYNAGGAGNDDNEHGGGGRNDGENKHGDNSKHGGHGGGKDHSKHGGGNKHRGNDDDSKGPHGIDERYIRHNRGALIGLDEILRQLS